MRLAHQNSPMDQARELEWLTQSAGIVALDDRAIVSVGGDDAHDWIQGQVTNQVEGVPAGGSVYAFVLTLKGRTLADVYVLMGDDEILLDVPKTQVDSLLARLERYIIMEDVDLEHRPDLGLLAAVGPLAHEVGEGGWPADRLGVGGRQWVVSTDALSSERDRLIARCHALGGGLVGEKTWRHAHVLLGRPLFGVDFGDWTYPQETGLNELAVSFKKGCYIGQETVVMLAEPGKGPEGAVALGDRRARAARSRDSHPAWRNGGGRDHLGGDRGRPQSGAWLSQAWPRRARTGRVLGRRPACPRTRSGRWWPGTGSFLRMTLRNPRCWRKTLLDLIVVAQGASC